MLELLKSLAVAIIMVPIVMAIMLGLIYGLGEVLSVISTGGRRDERPAHSSHHCSSDARMQRAFFIQLPAVFADITPIAAFLIALYYQIYNVTRSELC